MMISNDADFACTPLARHGRRAPSTAIKSLLIAGLAACSVAVLAGCEEQSYPTPSAEQTQPPPPPPPAPLMGAPQQTEQPPYSPCAQSPCAPAAAPAPAPDSGPMMAPRVIASTPVPNPPEAPAHERHRHHHHIWTSGEAQPAAPHRHTVRASNDGRWHVVGSAPANKAAAHVAAAPSPAPAPAAVHPNHQAAAPKPAVAAPPQKAAAAPAAAGAGIGNINDNTTGAPASADSDRYAALQSALSNLIGVDAVLATPDRFQTNQAADVTLTLPATFAQEAHDEAAKAGITDAAASVNIEAHLTGTGFTIAPDQPQAQPLLLGQPTVFHWKVTPTSQAVGSVKADLTAELQTVGRTLPLGSVQSQAGVNGVHLSGRLLGVALLILVLVVVAAWIVSRGGKGPAFRRKDI